MSLNTAETRQVFPYGYEPVYEGLLRVLGPAGYSVKHQDKSIGRILAGAGMSAFSWGEDVTLQVQRQSEASTEVIIQSNLKVGFNLAATGKNAQNAERIIGALSNYLRQGSTDAMRAAAAAPAANSPAILWVSAIGILLLILFSMMIR